MRWVMVRVFPVPAPARMQTGPDTACAASRCSSSRAASTVSARDMVPVCAPISDIAGPSLIPPSPPRDRVVGPILAADTDDPGKHPQQGRVPPASPRFHPLGGGPTRHDHGGSQPMTATPGAPVTMFTTQWCGYCVRLKKLMQREGIEFAEVDIENDATAADLVMRANGGNRTVPTLMFADGVALTNPSIDQVKAQLGRLSGAE